jgi:hypothetical protein
MYVDFAREIAPDKPDLDKLIGIAERHGMIGAA